MAEKTLIATVTVKAGTPVGMRQAVSIQEPGKSSVTTYTVPKGNVLIVKDVYIKSSGDVSVDGSAVFVKNDKEDVAKSAPLSTLLVSNPSRPRVPVLVFDEYDKLSIDFVNIVAGGAADATNTFYITVDEIEKKAPALGLAGLSKLRALFK